MGPGTMFPGCDPWTLAGQAQAPITGAVTPWRVLVSRGSHCEVWPCSCPMSAAHLASGAGASCSTEGIRGKGPEQPPTPGAAL